MSPIKTISVLGSGWLGLPLIKNLVDKGYRVKASTRSNNRVSLLTKLGVEAFVVDLENNITHIHSFLKSNLLIINIPSKNIDGFKSLLKEIEISNIEAVLFVSSTSVYPLCNKTIVESSGIEITTHPLFIIENLFLNSDKFATTIVRLSGLIGPKRHPGKFFSKGKILKNPEAYVNLIHQDDCIGIINQIIHQQAWADVFNCCADTHPTKREYYSRAAQSIGFEIPAIDNSNPPAFKIISNAKVKTLLDYTFLHADVLDFQYFLNTQ